MTPWYVLTRFRFVNRMKSGMIITTGGTTISAVLSARNTSRPTNCIRAIANAASAATAVQRTTEPAVRMTLFLNQSRNVEPWIADEKFPSDNGHGSEYGFCRYWCCVLNAVVTMKNAG